MKRHVIYLMVITAVLIAASAPGAPRLINYQGFLADDTGSPVTGPHNLTFAVYPDSAQGTQALWTEMHTAVSFDNGVFNVILGATTAMPDTLFLGDERWMGIQVDTDPEMTPMMRITSVPWALRATVADSALACPGGGTGGGINTVVAGPGLVGGGSTPVVTLQVHALPGSGLLVDPGDGVSIEPGGVTGDKLADSVVTSDKIATGGVASGNLMNNAVTAAKLDSLAVTGSKLANGAVSSRALDNFAVTNEKMGLNAVASSNLFNSAVTTSKLDTNAVTSGKIEDGTIAFDDIGQNGATDGQVIKWDDSIVPSGAWVAEDDSVGEGSAITGVYGGTGLTGGGDTDDITLYVDFGGNGSDTTVSRSDHQHDSLYVNEGQDSSVTTAMVVDGTILFEDVGQNGAADGQVIKWDDSIVPSGAWVAADDSVGEGSVITGVYGGTGLTGGGAADDITLYVDFGGNGSDTTVSRSDHHHDSLYVNEGQNNSVTTAMIVDGTILFEDVGQNSATHGQVMKWDSLLSAWNAADDDTGGSGGGGGWVDDGDVVRLDTAADSVGIGTTHPGAKLGVAGDIIATGTATFGSGHNIMATGAFVAGESNSVADSNAVVLGHNNEATGDYTTVSGGQFNQASGRFSVVGGGGGEYGPPSNIAHGDFSVVGGGSGNVAGRQYDPSSMSEYTTIGGGFNNIINQRGSTIAGGGDNRTGENGGSSPGEFATIGGGRNNLAVGDFSVVSGGGDLGGPTSNRAHGDYSVVGGGRANAAGDSTNATNESQYATVSGGFQNVAVSRGATVAGGAENWAGMSGGSPGEGEYAVVGGGRQNRARGQYSVVAGGGDENPGDGNDAAGDYCFIGGGKQNHAGGYSSWNFAVVGGGSENNAEREYTVVCGGDSNNALSNFAFVGGGSSNTASGPEAVVTGGMNNQAGGHAAAVAGGRENSAPGEGAAIPGGRYNEASGDYSLAAGWAAKARHNGSVVISALQSTDPNDSVSTGQDGQIVLRADNGLYITHRREETAPTFSHLIHTSRGAYLSNAGQWTDNSSSSMKENFTDVDGEALLEQLRTLPITRWNYKVDNADIQHVGPVAEDFYRVLGVGENSSGIAAFDLGGISLVAVKELYEKNLAQKAELESLQSRVDDLERLVEKLLTAKENSDSD
jgi:hypothetical protein